jgi:hypothetical protein
VIIGLRPPPLPTKPRWRRPLAVAIVLLIVVAVVVWAVLPSVEGLTRGSGHGSGIGAGRGCLLPTVPAPAISFDEQLLLVESGNSSSVSFHVPAVAQTDSNGYGPGYLVNGLTAAGYWYQVGITYDWPCGAGYVAGFQFFTEVWGPGNAPISGPSATPIVLGGGDSVNLSLRFSGSNVVMSASDPATGLNQSSVYSAENSTHFAGGLTSGWFTGPMTEWYHAEAYYGGEEAVNFTANTPIAGNDSDEVTLGVDEFGLSGGSLFDQTTPIELTCSCYYPFSYDGAAVEVGPASFVTGA